MALFPLIYNDYPHTVNGKKTFNIQILPINNPVTEVQNELNLSSTEQIIPTKINTEIYIQGIGHYYFF